jgi:hypothetical protein
MTRNDVRTEFPKFDAGQLLPGCSIPVVITGDPIGETVHAFREFKPLPIDGLDKQAIASLTDSLADVTRSLNRLHAMGCCDGRITSTSFHNRGSDAKPAGTLWIDPLPADATDAVHDGDPEAMYWTATRLRSGRTAVPADDWYAMGIVMAEIALSSDSVHKIWELSRRDGTFVDSLVKNLRGARADKRLTKMAIQMVRQGAEGNVTAKTLEAITASRGSGISRAGYLSIGLAAIALALALWNVSVGALSRASRVEEIAKRDELIAALQGESEILKGRLESLKSVSAAVRGAPAASSRTQSPVVRSGDRDRWTAELAGASLEQAIKSSESFEPADWHQSLRRLQAIPGQKRWRKHDSQLRRLIQMSVDAPWDSAKAEQVGLRLAALNEAYSRWSTWARGSRSVEELKTQQQLMPGGAVKEFLGQWLAEALEVRFFEFRVAVLNAGEDNRFLAHRIGFETPADSESLSWVWDSVDGSGAAIEMQVDEYRAGQGLSFWLQQDSAIPYWNTTVIRCSLDSPLLVWQLANGLKLVDGVSGYSVLLTTNKRFGPPVRMEVPSEVAEVNQGKKVVDPMDSLPF